MANSSVSCEKCNKQMEANSANYIPKDENSMMVLCSNCAEHTVLPKIVEEKKPSFFQRLFGMVKPTVEEDDTPILEVPKKKQVKPIIKRPVIKQVYCDRCNYTFRLNKEKATSYTLRCPYCGQGDRLSLREDFVKSMIEEVSQPKPAETAKVETSVSKYY